MGIISDVGYCFVLLQYILQALGIISFCIGAGVVLYCVIRWDFDSYAIRVIAKCGDIAIGSFACILFIQLVINHWC